MVIDFSKINTGERPVVILKSASGKRVGALGTILNLIGDFHFNETSTITFNVPAYILDKDSKLINTPHYDEIVGMRRIELKEIGQFILMNPREVNDGVKRYKECKAYSLEFEFTFKKLTITQGTYNLYNPTAMDNTVLGIILELMPSWSVGYISPSLIGKYRTFETSGDNIYNFLKGTAQTAYNCIFYFDTINRTINAIDVSDGVGTNPIFISLDNLAKEISIEENSEEIVTRLDVNGADGVDIREVNPMGTNTLINLDYFMNNGFFDDVVKQKYEAWKQTFESYQQAYYDLSVDYSLQTMNKVSKSSELTDLQGELTALENLQAATIQAIAQNLKTDEDLAEVNSQIEDKQKEIKTKESEIANATSRMEAIFKDMQDVNAVTKFESFFTDEENLMLDTYIKDDSVSNSSFVYTETSSYTGDDSGFDISSDTFAITNSSVTMTESLVEDYVYQAIDGLFSLTSHKITASVVRGHLDYDPKTQEALFTAYLGNGEHDGTKFPSGCISVVGSLSGTPTHNETSLTVKVDSAYLYLTSDTTEYDKRAVAWDLFEYGKDIAYKLSQPSFTFSVSSANFLQAKEFVEFKNKFDLGEKIYIQIADGKVLTPIAIGAHIEWDNPTGMTLSFSDKYISGDSSFLMADLLEQSVSMGKSVDTNKYTYSAFIDSGASTSVKEFMNSAIDVSKNAILSTSDQAISWGDSGIRMRKWADDSHTTYEPYEVWMNNNSIMMTSNSWSSAEIAIGRFADTNMGECWGIVAPNIVGTLLAGENLVIESAKKDGGTSVFKVDADGCVLYNSSFDIVTNNTQIALDPQFGIVIGEYPVYTTNENTRAVTVTKTVDTDKAKFWVDPEGNLFFEGTLRATTGEFDGKVTAREGYIGLPSTGWTIQETSICNGKTSLYSTTEGMYVGVDGISVGDNDTYIRMVASSGLLDANNVKVRGDIEAISGKIGGCTIVDDFLTVTGAHIKDIDAGTITTGTLSADFIHGGTINGDTVNVTNLKASSITTGTLSVDRIPNLSADKITTGKLSADRIDVGSIYIDAAQISSGTIDSARIGNATITSAKISSLEVKKVTGGTNNEAIEFTNGTFSGTLKTCYFGASGGNTTLSTDGSYVQLGTAGVYMALYQTSTVYGVRNSGVTITMNSANGVLNGTWLGTSAMSVDSDMTLKNTINALDQKYSIMFDSLIPRTYKYNNGTSDRLHIGFIAQEVKDALDQANLTTQEFAGYVAITNDDGSTKLTLRYEEFIALNTMQIQSLKARISELENKIALLQS